MCLPELVVSLVLGPIVAGAGGSMRVPMLVGAVSCAAATLVIFFGFEDGWHGTWVGR